MVSEATTGLTTKEATERLRADGPNVVEREPPASAWMLVLRQLESPLIWLLFVAAVVSGLSGEVADAVAIGAIVLLNGAVGFFQEFRAERAVLALRALSAPHARVLRDGRVRDVVTADVVRGDVLVLEAGDVVAADATLLEVNELIVNEAMLTGESVPVHKSTTPAAAGAPLAERRNAVFMGTAVAGGTGRAVVTGTGVKTELGKISHLLATATDETTPLQNQLARISRVLIVLCLAIVALVAALGFARGLGAMDVFRSAVSLAVAAVPEGLPAVVTIALALGVERMVRRNVLVRRLPAVETLGCASVICTDKTGTLTKGEMVVRELFGADERELLRAAASCCDAELGDGSRPATGDPTELALLERAKEQGLTRDEIERSNPRVSVKPFDSERKRMSVARADGVVYVKGAVESVRPLCTRFEPAGETALENMAERGLRVLAIATGKGDREEELELLGLIGIADPPRPEVIDAIAAARGAGILTVMVTGDHPTTARAIARELDMIRPDVPLEELVHARTTPSEKLEIVRKWKGRGHVVAMTGDGVNDAPALREANIGVAMGKTGTEVTREAADMILTDDNFASIVAAVREGRGIFENIRKTVLYLLAGNTSELCVVLGAALLGLPPPLLPLHLLWINLATDSLPALALVTDPVDPDAMGKPPRKTNQPMLGRAEWRKVAVTGLIEATVVLGAFTWALRTRDVTAARDLAFTVLVFAELFRGFSARSRDRVLFELGALTNVRLVGVIVVSVLLQLLLHELEWSRQLFGLVPLTLPDVVTSLALGLIPVTLLELEKLARRGLQRLRRTAA